MNELENYYEHQKEPIKSCLLALRTIILGQDKHISASWKYRTPFFCYKRKMLCYLCIHKKYKQPYIGIIDGKYLNEPFLIQENRSRIKIILFDPNQDLPVHTIAAILQKAINLHKMGIVKW